LRRRHDSIAVAEEILCPAGSSGHFHAHLSQGHVFHGTFVDDLASVVHHVDRPSRVLILGASLSAALLPMSIFVGVEEVTLVDIEPIDSPLLDQLRDQFQITRVVCNAEKLAGCCVDSFDLIYCDLFTDWGYAQAMIDGTFYRQLDRLLAPGGLIAVNAFDVPAYLSPECGQTVTTTIIALLQSAGLSVKFLTHRRNTLVLGTRNEEREKLADHVTRELFGLDRERYFLAKRRALEFRDAPSLLEESARCLTTASFQEIGALLHFRGTVLLGFCNSRFQIGDWKSFRDFAMSADTSSPVVGKALAGSDVLRRIVLMELAASSFSDTIGSLDRLRVLLDDCPNLLCVRQEFEGQLLVDIHAICIASAGNENMFRELAGNQRTAGEGR
jgi:hypothetical protein